jgi:hypothetical protein
MSRWTINKSKDPARLMRLCLSLSRLNISASATTLTLTLTLCDCALHPDYRTFVLLKIPNTRLARLTVFELKAEDRELYLVSIGPRLNRRTNGSLHQRVRYPTRNSPNISSRNSVLPVAFIEEMDWALSWPSMTRQLRDKSAMRARHPMGTYVAGSYKTGHEIRVALG